MSPLPALKKLTKPTATNLMKLWGALSKVPKGGVVFGRILGTMAPYTGSIRPEVVTLERGHAVVRMRDAKDLRNHLKSVHALALMNLGEVATGIAMLVSVPDDARGIVSKLEMEYLKKARGTITAECRCKPPASNERKQYEVEAVLRDSSGEVVSKAKATWLVGPA